MKDEEFGGALKKDNLVRDLLPNEIKQIPTELKKAEAIENNKTLFLKNLIKALQILTKRSGISK